MNVDLHRDTSMNALIRQLQPKYYSDRHLLRSIAKYQNVREAFEGTIPYTELTDSRNILLTRRDNTSPSPRHASQYRLELVP